MLVMLQALNDAQPKGLHQELEKTSPSRLPVGAWNYVAAMFDHYQFH